MMVFRDVGVKITAVAINHDLAQQASVGKLMKCIVHSRQRYLYQSTDRLGMQAFGRDMSVAASKQQLGERDALAGRAQVGST